MDAIKDGVPKTVVSYDLGIENIKASKIHEIGSRILPFIKLTEFYQTNPIAEFIVTRAYTRYLRRHNKGILEEFKKLKEKFPDKKKWVVISTHFALAHSISAVKKQLEEELDIKIYLCVVVTDDSPQRVWVVDGSDRTFVASEKTRTDLAKYFPKDRQDSVKTISFPISERLAQNLALNELQFVIDQLDPKKVMPTQIEIPISGAAVQLDFFENFINDLCRNNFEFTVIGQESSLTAAFFNKIRGFPRVQVSIGINPWQTVDLYESLFYQASRPAIEITKPSEQAFKAILTPRQRGGVILLLTGPVGRQEYDNLNFLIRNKLMPSEVEQKQLFVETDFSKWIAPAAHWRALRLPDDAMIASNFVKKLKETGIFYSMLSFVPEEKPELMSNGVAKIWEEIGKMLSLS